MSVRTQNPVSVVRSVVETIQEREVTFLAASISYYTLVSLVPLLTLGLLVASFVGGDALRDEVLALAREYLLPSGSTMIENALTDPTGQGLLSVVSIGVTFWGALKLFRGLDIAFSRIYGSEAGGIVDQVRDGAIALGSIGAGTIGVAVATAVIAVLNLPFVGYISPILLLGLLVAAFFPFYYVFPDAGLTPREALPGTLFAAVGWSVLGAVFGVYAANAGGVTGALGAILLLVTWFYFSGILVLTGAVVNAVLAGKVTPGPSDGGAPDRQVQHRPARQTERTMSVDDATGDESGEADVEPRGAPDIEQLEDRVEELRADLDSFESDVQARTVERPDVESELKRYVRNRMRQGKARGWGPYLVLLYGTAVTIAAFVYLNESPLLAVIAMLITYLSTLGLYVLFVVFGAGLGALGVPGRLLDWVRDRRS